MKLNAGERIILVLTLLLAAFFAGYHVRGAQMTGTVLVKTSLTPPSPMETAERSVPAEAEIPEEAEASEEAEAAAEPEALPESDGLVDLNEASLAELEALPGIGPVLAERILAYREANGGFSSVDELLEVEGIGQKTYENLYAFVKVGTVP